MITTFLHWSADISAAPKGEMVTTTVTAIVKGEVVERQRTEHVPAKLLALTPCGKIISTHWMPASKHTQDGDVLDGDRWHGFTRGHAPVLWAAWPDAGKIAASLAALRAGDAEAAE